MIEKLLWWTYSQNNSGGYFIQNDDVDEYVIIQAANEKAAQEIFKRVTEESSYEWCHCCGERWYPDPQDEGTEVPVVFGKSVYEPSKDNSWFRDAAILYFDDGHKERVRLKEGVVERLK